MGSVDEQQSRSAEEDTPLQRASGGVGRCGVWSVVRAGATSRLRAATVSDPHDIVMVERSVVGIDDGDAGDGAVRRSSRAKRPAPCRGSVAGSTPPAQCTSLLDPPRARF